MNAAVVLRSKRRRVARSGPLDRDRAYTLLFREKTIAAVWSWLQQLAVPIRDLRDVLQEVFLQAHQSFHTYDPMRSRPERWLNKITVHVAAHYLDRAHHRREELQPEALLEAVDPTPPAPEQIQAEQDRLLLWELLGSVDPELRSVLIAHDIDGIPMAEIAEQHGIPLSTAYKWRARALAALAAAHRRREEEEEAVRVPRRLASRAHRPRPPRSGRAGRPLDRGRPTDVARAWRRKQRNRTAEERGRCSRGRDRWRRGGG